MNRGIIIGNLTSDPRMINTSTGKLVAKATVAVNERYKDSRTGDFKEITSFIDISAWSRTAERLSEECKKGTKVFVSGRIRTSEYVDKEGNNRKGFEIQVDEFYSLARSAKNEDGDRSGVEHSGSPKEEEYSIEDEIII
jgi:single-strand DNA-binding protein